MDNCKWEKIITIFIEQISAEAFSIHPWKLYWPMLKWRVLMSACVCMCVCVCVCMDESMHTWACINTHTHTHTECWACSDVWILRRHAHTHTHTHSCVFLHSFIVKEKQTAACQEGLLFYQCNVMVSNASSDLPLIRELLSSSICVVNSLTRWQHH